MHPITDLSRKKNFYMNVGTWETWEAEILLPWLRKKSVHLSNDLNCTIHGKEIVNLLLEIPEEKKTLEEKIAEAMGIPKMEMFDMCKGSPIIKAIVDTTRQHFRENPGELK